MIASVRMVSGVISLFSVRSVRVPSAEMSVDSMTAEELSSETVIVEDFDPY